MRVEVALVAQHFLLSGFHFFDSPTPTLQLCSDNFCSRVSDALGACGGVSLSLDASGMEIVAAVVALDNLIQFKFSYAHFV